MSRISDTRIRTREAAARLVAAGRLPHELTVDLIYAEIRQGSRTTINDELKQWKDEKTRVDALSAQLPPAVADAMLAAWAIAVEHGEKVYDVRVAELERELAAALARAEAAERACAVADEARRQRDVDVTGQATQIGELQQQLTAAIEDKQAAHARLATVEQQRDAAREQADERLRATRAAHEQALAALRASLDTRDAAFQGELDKATQRMEGVQKHMMQQISEARGEQRRTEGHAAKIQQKNETLQAEMGALRTELIEKNRILEQSGRTIEQAEADLRRWQGEREALLAEMAEMRGKLVTTAQLVASLEARATAAEARATDGISGRRGAATSGGGKTSSPHRT